MRAPPTATPKRTMHVRFCPNGPPTAWRIKIFVRPDCPCWTKTGPSLVRIWGERGQKMLSSGPLYPPLLSGLAQLPAKQNVNLTPPHLPHPLSLLNLTTAAVPRWPLCCSPARARPREMVVALLGGARTAPRDGRGVRSRLRLLSVLHSCSVWESPPGCCLGAAAAGWLDPHLGMEPSDLNTHLPPRKRLLAGFRTAAAATPPPSL